MRPQTWDGHVYVQRAEDDLMVWPERAKVAYVIVVEDNCVRAEAAVKVLSKEVREHGGTVLSATVHISPDADKIEALATRQAKGKK